MYAQCTYSVYCSDGEIKHVQLCKDNYFLSFNDFKRFLLLYKKHSLWFRNLIISISHWCVRKNPHRGVPSKMASPCPCFPSRPSGSKSGNRSDSWRAWPGSRWRRPEGWWRVLGRRGAHWSEPGTPGWSSSRTSDPAFLWTDSESAWNRQIKCRLTFLHI